jgi:hypothetical protein
LRRRASGLRLNLALEHQPSSSSSSLLEAAGEGTGEERGVVQFKGSVVGEAREVEVEAKLLLPSQLE